MPSSLSSQEMQESAKRIRKAYEPFYASYPAMAGKTTSERQPVHTVYGGAQIWKADSCVKLGELARRTLHSYAPNHAAFARVLGWTMPTELTATIYERVLAKLTTEPVEDFRIDFEDGYGHRPDAEEDRQAETAAEETARGMREKTLPPFIGIRIKTFSQELVTRAVRTLDIFVSSLLAASGGRLPANFVVTLPKVVFQEQVALLAEILTTLEKRLGLPHRAIPIEIMVETTQAVIGPAGLSPFLGFAAAADGRCRGAHFGTYDYTASCEVVAHYQSMDNPVCDYAKHCMQVSLAGTGVWLSDGATNIMPVAPHRGENLSASQMTENTASVHRAWRTAYGHIRHSLGSAFYQGWDLHPAQLPIRYAAVYQFFLESYESSAERLGNFIAKAAQATLAGEIFDDAATGQGLLNYFLRALSCQAITPDEATRTGLSVAEINSRSFMKIVEARRVKT